MKTQVVEEGVLEEVAAVGPACPVVEVEVAVAVVAVRNPVLNRLQARMQIKRTLWIKVIIKEAPLWRKLCKQNKRKKQKKVTKSLWLLNIISIDYNYPHIY
jgi:hypothetical protein